jgi:hypothetical protein
VIISDRLARAASLSLFALLFAPPAIAQTTGTTAIPHPLNAQSVLPTDANGTAISLFDHPINAGACTSPVAVQVGFSLPSTYQSGTLNIWVQASADCTTIPTDTTKLLNGGVAAATVGRPSDNFPKPPNVDVLSTKTFLDAGNLCATGAPQQDLIEYRLCVVYKDTNNPNEATNKIIDALQVRVDTKPPGPLTDVAVTPGDGSLTLTWTPTDPDNTTSYHVVATAQDGSGDVRDFQVPGPATGGRIDGVPNGVEYEIVVTATDLAGNESAPSTPVTGAGVPTCNFWSCYTGREKGGYCFVSTAAYGSYDAPFVQVFRDFRDRVLMKSAPGRAFVLWYYRHGLPAAVWLAEHEWARRAAAVMLVVPYVAVWPLVRLTPAAIALAAAIALSVVLLWVLRRRQKAAALLLLVGFVATPAFAVDRTNELIEREDDNGVTKVVPPPRFEGAIKLSPYYPLIDSDADANGSYATYFGSSKGGIFSKGSRLRIDVSGDVYVLRDYGLLGFNGTVGFWQAQGYARICQAAAPPAMGNTCDTGNIDSAPQSSDKVLFTIIPLSVGVVYKLDVFWRRFGVPLIPFVRAGIDAYFWRVDAGNKQARTADAKYTHDLKPNGYGGGATFGFHVNPGIAFALDVIEPNAARRAYTFMGIKGSYVTFEWMFAQINDFYSKNSWNLSQSTFLAGIAIEF